MARPILQALLLADHVYQDLTTKKHVICGVFGKLLFRSRSAIAQKNTDETERKEAPEQVSIQRLMTAGSPFAYLNLTEVQGTKEFELRFVDLSDNSVLFGGKFGVQSQDPLQNIELTVPLPPLPTPHEGAFALELLCDNELLGSLRVLAVRDPNHE